MNVRRVLIPTLAALAATLVPGATAMPDNVPPASGDREPASVNPSGVTGSNVPASRQGARLSVEAEVVAIYQRGAEIINQDLARAVRELAANPEGRSAEFARARAASLLTQIRRELRTLDARASRIVGDETRRAYIEGLRDAAAQLDELGVSDRLPGGFEPMFNAVNAPAIEAVARDTVARMSAAADGQAQRAATIFRSLATAAVAEPDVNRAIADGLVTGRTRDAEGSLRRLFDADPSVAKTYRQLGAQSVTVGGWTGPLRQYASTVVRTRTREATVNARHTQLGEAGIDLVQIGGRVSSNFCTRFLGLVCSLGAARDGYPALSELPSGGPPFHPNCSKGTAAYIPELVSSRRAADAEKAGRAFETARRNGLLTTDLRG